jgi:hypothetical protein
VRSGLEVTAAPRRLALICLSTLRLLAWHAPASAYTGGPLLVDVLGWDAKTHRVYFHTIPANEGDNFGAVYYFDLDGVHKERRIQLAWSQGEAEGNEPHHVQQLKSLRSRLTPLLPEPVACLGWGTSIVSADSVDSLSSGKRARYRLHFSGMDGPRFECTAYGLPDACIKNAYAIPERKERLYVFAFRGNVFDMAETQVAVLVSEPSDRAIQAAWERDR